jgi:group I intron endonuclease
MTHSVYWIRHKDHTDMFNQGYIGVSKNPDRRWLEHGKRSPNLYLKNAIKKYGWDNLIKEVILIGEETYCYDLEAKIRSTKQTGWNIAEGGAKPPSMLGLRGAQTSMFGKKHSKETREKMKGRVSPNKGKTLNAETKEKLRQAHVGKKHSEKTIEKMRVVKIGKRPTSQTIEKLKIARSKDPRGAESKHYKGDILATEILTGKQTVLRGPDEMRDIGFCHVNVYKCVNEKRKSHKGHTFKRLEK